MRSIRLKLIFWICVLFLCIGAVIYIPLSYILPQKITSQILKRDLEIAKYLSNEAKDLLLLDDRVALSILLYDNLDKLIDAQYLFVQGTDGEVIAHTFSEGFPVGLLNFNLTTKGHEVKGFLNKGKKIYDIAVPILEGQIGVLHLGASLESGKKDIAAIKKINYYVAIVILIGLGVGIFVFLIMGFLFSSQIIKLKNLAARIGDGDLEAKIDIKSKDEIGALGLAFNEMAKNLKEKILEIKRLHIIEERDRIAFDLHDGCAQDMASVIKSIELSKKLFKIDPTRAFKELDSLQENTKAILNRTRHMILDLKSSEEADGNLLDRLSDYVLNYKKQNGIDIKFNTSGDINNIPPEKSKTIFYIITEALNNVKKHSQAKSVRLNLEVDGSNSLKIDIKDNGKGFNVDGALSRTKRNGKLGLISMRERANSLRGKIVINSSLNKGTRICVNVPAIDKKMGEI